MTVPRSYSGPLSMNPKKKDFYIDVKSQRQIRHVFYENLPTISNAKEYNL